MEAYLILSITAYLIGSIPTGYLLAQTFGKKDISKKGSKNIGATNAYRVAGKIVGISTLTADIFKGIIAVLIAQYTKVGDTELAELIAGFSVVLGHIFPIWLNFKGGKGVATGLAVITMIAPSIGIIAFSAFTIMFLFFRIVAVASLTAALTATLVSSFTLSGEIAYTVLVISLIIFWRHKENVSRILDGKEKKI